MDETKPAPRFFLVGSAPLDNLPLQAKVDWGRMAVDYVAVSHEMAPDCDCRHCRAMFTAKP